MWTATVAKENGPDKGQSFDAFFQEHYQLVYRAAYSVTHSRQDAEDVLQTVFLNLLRRGDPIDLANNVKGYLYRAAMNEALHILRTRARQAIVDGLEHLEREAGPARSAAEELAREDLLDAIARLKPEHVKILVLRYEYGYSDEDIGKMLGRTRVGIAVILYRARAQLKKLMRSKRLPDGAAGRRRQILGRQLSTEGKQL